MSTLSREEIRSYVERRLADPKTLVIEAKKTGNIYAVPGTVGRSVITFTTDENGAEVIERIQEVAIDPKTGNPGWIVTKLDEHNDPGIDCNGHKNQYIIADSKFREMYEPVSGIENVYAKRQIERFIPAETEMEFDTKYGKTHLLADGFIKVTSLDNISSITKNDFYDTYEVLNPDALDSQKKHTL